MNVIYERCCGMDIHKNTIAACLITGRKKEIRSFSICYGLNNPEFR